jgi:hypothetical protein
LATRESEPQRLRHQPISYDRKALVFVENLYAVGATTVLIKNPFVDSEGYAYADSLIVRVPADGRARLDIEQFLCRGGPQ